MSIGMFLLWSNHKKNDNVTISERDKNDNSSPPVKLKKEQAGAHSSSSVSLNDNDTVGRLMAADDPKSSDPVERAAAGGAVLATKITRIDSEGTHWRRERLLQSDIQPRVMRLVEEWRGNPASRQNMAAVKRELFLADQLIVKTATGVDMAVLSLQLARSGMKVESQLDETLYTIRLGRADLEAVPDALKVLEGMKGVIVMAEADGVGFGGDIPNDPSFSVQWGLHNTGQSGGVTGADVKAGTILGCHEQCPRYCHCSAGFRVEFHTSRFARDHMD